MFVGLNEVKEGQSNLIGAQIEQGIKEKSQSNSYQDSNLQFCISREFPNSDTKEVKRGGQVKPENLGF